MLIIFVKVICQSISGCLSHSHASFNSSVFFLLMWLIYHLNYFFLFIFKWIKFEDKKKIWLSFVVYYPGMAQESKNEALIAPFEQLCWERLRAARAINASEGIRACPLCSQWIRQWKRYCARLSWRCHNTLYVLTV